MLNRHVHVCSCVPVYMCWVSFLCGLLGSLSPAVPNPRARRANASPARLLACFAHAWTVSVLAHMDDAARLASKAWFCPICRYVARYFGQSITRSQANHYDSNAPAVCFLRTLSLLMQIAPKTQVTCNRWVTTTWHGDTMWHAICSVVFCRAA